ncbi:hypothetical protein [Microbulbifer taiwanensis]|uniref:hypothetical protein n=1 Tax=Microbulbifer taiwanensis TaxID=986746 RepID=UPI0036207685
MAEAQRAGQAPGGPARPRSQVRHDSADAGAACGAGEGTAAVYYSRWQDSRRLQLGWILERQRVEHDMHFEGRWDWRNGRAAPQAAWEPLRQMLDQLPEGACALVASQNGLGIQWRETGGDSAFRSLESALGQFRPTIEEAIRQPKPAQDRGSESPGFSAGIAPFTAR